MERPTVAAPAIARPKQSTPDSVLRHRSLPESVHEILCNRILNNELPAGTPLVELDIADEFGVSRTTVRAAMRELQAERLIEINPRRGSTVTRMSPEDMAGVCFARYTLEVAGLKAALRMGRRELANRMEKIVAVMDAAAVRGDVVGVIEADTDLHRVVVETSEHPLVVDLWSTLNAQMGALMRSAIDHQRIDLEETVARHVELVRQFRELAPGRVVSAVRDHYMTPKNAPRPDHGKPARDV